MLFLWMFMRVAITGANGFVGRHLAKVLSFQGIETRSLVRSTCDTPLGECKNEVLVNYSDLESLQIALAGCDAVVHLAAKTHGKGGASWSHFYAANVQLTDQIAQAAKLSGIARFIYFSSVKVLGESSTPEQPFTLTSTQNPEDFYGKSKLQAETALTTYFEEKPSTLIIIRPPLVWGENAKGNLSKILRLAKKGVPLPLAGISNQRHWISLDNLCNFTLHLLKMPDLTKPLPALLVCDPIAKSTTRAVTDLLTAQHIPARLFRLPSFVWQTLILLPFIGPAVKKIIGSLVIDASDTWELTGWKPSVANDREAQNA